MEINFVCKIIGHSWKYKDYSDWILHNGNPYPFLVARRCSICERHEYYYHQWVPERKNHKLDVQHEHEEKKEIPLVLNNSLV